MFWIWTFTERTANPWIRTSDSLGFKSWFYSYKPWMQFKFWVPQSVLSSLGFLRIYCISSIPRDIVFLHLTSRKSECILQLEWAAPFSFRAVCENNRASYHMLDVVKLDKWDTMYKAFSMHGAHSPGGEFSYNKMLDLTRLPGKSYIKALSLHSKAPNERSTRARIYEKEGGTKNSLEGTSPGIEDLTSSPYLR